jgi:pilus assembly protein CpaE
MSVSLTTELPLLTHEADVERAVMRAAGAAGLAPTCVRRVEDVVQLASRIEATAASVAVVDLDPEPLIALGSLAPIATRFPDTRFVVMCGELRNDVLLQAMQLGVRHCIVKSTVGTELPPVLSRLLADAAPAPAPGRLITVLTASGGCGGTTIAINLAEECRHDGTGRALLVDLDQHYGAVSSYLGLQGSFGITDVLDHKGTIDSHLISSTTVNYDEGLHVLLSPASVNFSQPVPINWGRLENAIAACRRTFVHTVVDAPRVPMDVAADLARNSALTLIVFELDVIDIRSARAMMNALSDRGVLPSAVVPVANRCAKRNTMLGLQDARDALGGVEVARVTNDWNAAIKSINFGQPVARAAPRSELREDIRALLLRADETSPTSPFTMNGHANSIKK